MSLRRRLRRGPGALAPRAAVAIADVRGELRELDVPSTVDRVLLVVRDGTAVVGQVWLRAQPHIPAHQQWEAVHRELGTALARRSLRAAVEAALGRPAAAVSTRRALSVVVCARRVDALEDTLASLRGLHRPADEVLVTGAGADVEAVCREVGARRVPADGLAPDAARDLAAARARGELVAFLEAGTVVEGGWLDGVDAAFDDPLVVAVTGYVGPLALWHAQDVRDELGRGALRHPERRVLDGAREDAAGAAAVAGEVTHAVVRRSALDAHGGLAAHGRPDGWFEAVLRRGLRVVYDPARVAWRHGRGGAVSGEPRRLPVVAAPARRSVLAGGAPSAAVTAEPPAITVAVTARDDARLADVLSALAARPGGGAEADVVVAAAEGCAVPDGAARLPGRVAVVRPHAPGLAAARNAALAVARRPVVLFLDDDARPAPDLVARHAAAHAAQRRDTWVAGATTCEPGEGRWARELRAAGADRLRRLAAPGHRWTFADVCDVNASVRTEVLLELGGFDEAFTGDVRQDHELGVRLLDAGVALVHCGAALAARHVPGDVRTALVRAREQGRFDARIAARHPRVAGQLAYAVLREPRIGRGEPGRLRRGLDDTVPVEHWAAAVEHAEGLGEARWRALVLERLAAAYLVGVRRGVREAGQLEPLRPVRVADPVTAALDGSPAVPPPAAAGLDRVDYVLTLRGVPAATVPDVLPGGHWDWDDLVDRAVAALLDAGRLGAAAFVEAPA